MTEAMGIEIFEEYQKDIYSVEHKALNHPDDIVRGVKALKNLWKSLQEDMKDLTEEEKEEMFARRTAQFLNRVARDWMRGYNATGSSR